MQNQAARNRYVDDGAGVVPPPRLLIMLYDRLVLDLEQAETAMRANEIVVANDKLIHAQSILHELRAALNKAVWDGADNLEQLYIWFTSELMKANVKKDPKLVKTCLGMIRQLQGAWHGAYETVLAEQVTASAQ